MTNNSKKQQRDPQSAISISDGTLMALIQADDLDEFAPVRAHAKLMETALLSDEMLNCEHGDLEQFLSVNGNELVRLYLQGALNARSKRETQLTEVIGADEIARTHVRQDCERGLTTLFGEVTVSRMGYSNRVPDSVSLFPLDLELNLPLDKYSHGLRRRTGAEARKQSFDEAIASVGSTTGGKVPKRQAQEVVSST